MFVLASSGLAGRALPAPGRKAAAGRWGVTESGVEAAAPRSTSRYPVTRRRRNT